MFKKQKINHSGFTLIELIVITGILSILLLAVLAALNPLQQFNKSFDARRLFDINSISSQLEDYYNDSQCYPSTIPFGLPWVPYMNKVPQDPQTALSGTYSYVADTKSANCPQWGAIFAKLSVIPATPQCTIPPSCLPKGYTTQYACKTNGIVPCDVMPTIAISPTQVPNNTTHPDCTGPTIYGTDGSWCCKSDGSYNFYQIGYCTDHAKQAPHNKPPGIYAVSSYADGWYDNTWYDSCSTGRKGLSPISEVGETICGAARVNGQITVMCGADAGGASYYACSVSTNPDSSCVADYDSSGKLLGGACTGKENDTDKTPPTIQIKLPYQGEAIQSGTEITLAVSIQDNVSFRDPVRYFIDNQELNCTINNVDGLIGESTWWNKVGNGLDSWCDWKIPSTGANTSHTIKYVGEDIVGNTTTVQTTVVQQ